MFIGHFGVAAGGKAIARSPSLGTWLMAAQFLDLLWPIFLLLGLEHVKITPGITRLSPLVFTDYPYSHSLAMAVLWSLLFAVVYVALKRDASTGVLLGAGVLSHWFLDLIVHRPDLPLAPGQSRMAGLSLWNHPVATLLLEIPLFVIGVCFYYRTTRAKDNVGRYALWPFWILLLMAYAGNLAGPPPPSVHALAWVGLGQSLLVAWAYWGDAHRQTVVVIQADAAAQ